MTIPPRSVSLPGESIFTGKDSFRFPGFERRWTDIVRSGRFVTGNPKESPSSPRFSIRLILSCTRFFNPFPGRSPMDHGARREEKRFTSVFGGTRKAYCKSFISNFVIRARIARAEFILDESTPGKAFHSSPGNPAPDGLTLFCGGVILLRRWSIL